jgi:hypothetical protein
MSLIVGPTYTSRATYKKQAYPPPLPLEVLERGGRVEKEPLDIRLVEPFTALTKSYEKVMHVHEKFIEFLQSITHSPPEKPLLLFLAVSAALQLKSVDESIVFNCGAAVTNFIKATTKVNNELTVHLEAVDLSNTKIDKQKLEETIGALRRIEDALLGNIEKIKPLNTMMARLMRNECTLLRNELRSDPPGFSSDEIKIRAECRSKLKEALIALNGAGHRLETELAILHGGSKTSALP